VTTIDGERRATHTVYNAAGQPTEIHRFQRAAVGSCSISTELPQNAGFAETRWRRFEYNAGGLQSAEIDARDNRTELFYEGLGRLVVTRYADAREAHQLMDQRDQVVYRKDRSGDRAYQFFDSQGRMYHLIEGNSAGTIFLGRNIRTSFDRAGRPVWRDVSTQPTTTFDSAHVRDVRNYGYDPAGRMTSEQWRPEGVGGISFTTGYGYDVAGNRTSIVWPGAWTANYTYDAANRIQTVSFPGAGGSVTLSHDSLSRRTGIDRPGAAADTTYTYEPDNDLASLNHAFVAGSGPGAVSFSYGHDAAGKTTTIGISQPAFEWLPSLSYARSYGVANELNQIGSAGGIGIGWNADGNMTSDGVNTYSWGYGNRMIGASRKGMTATYDYDSDDRRTKKTVNGVVTRTLWSGADELAEYDVNGDLIRRFVPDGTGAMDARLATVTPAGAVYWYHVDHQGTVIATSDSAGQTVGTASYSPYGEFAAGASTPPQHSPFGYTGRHFDVETGLYQYRARYYSPRLGQFLSIDPIGTKDDPNLYGYVGFDPVNSTDPTGMCRVYCPFRSDDPAQVAEWFRSATMTDRFMYALFNGDPPDIRQTVYYFTELKAVAVIGAGTKIAAYQYFRNNMLMESGAVISVEIDLGGAFNLAGGISYAAGAPEDGFGLVWTAGAGVVSVSGDEGGAGEVGASANAIPMPIELTVGVGHTKHMPEFQSLERIEELAGDAEMNQSLNNCGTRIQRAGC
jgi:RHS repeat-associated protein